MFHAEAIKEQVIEEETQSNGRSSSLNQAMFVVHRQGGCEGALVAVELIELETIESQAIHVTSVEAGCDSSQRQATTIAMCRCAKWQ